MQKYKWKDVCCSIYSGKEQREGRENEEAAEYTENAVRACPNDRNHASIRNHMYGEKSNKIPALCACEFEKFQNWNIKNNS